jgi:hypothetical protein
MRAPACAILSIVALAPLAACGSSGTGPTPGAMTPSSGFGSSGAATPGTEAGVGASASPTDAGGALAVADGAMASGAGSGSTTLPDASLPEGGEGGSAAGDAGGAPYKGVANSACADLVTLGAAWYYNWTLSPGSCTASQFVPMIWGHTGNEQSASGITTEINGLVSAGYKTVLGFNEPDNTSQSNISVATAISLWPSFTKNASLRIGSPATQANSSGQAWFTNFMKQVNADTTGSLRVDFIAAHWYGWNSGSCEANASSLESYVRWLEGIPGNRPIWLTEWGCLNQSNPTAAVVQTFFSGAIAMLAKHPRIERYGWYPWTTNNELVTKSGPLTALGTIFAAAPSFK